MGSLSTALCVIKLWYLGSGGIDTHIKVDHFNQECKSLDGIHRHIRNCKTDNLRLILTQ